jgi:hypothetical protein
MILTAVFISIFAFVFCFILTDSEMIFEWYYNLIKRLPVHLFNPLGGCCYCFGGQVALWYYLFTFETYSVINHVVLITLTIFFIHILTILNSKWN